MGTYTANGILNVLKPPGMTSFDVVAALRKILGTRKIGHTGTLDPGAVGVLPVCIGNATKAIEYMTEKDKLYRAELTLGISTDTQDSSGTVLEISKADVTEQRIREVLDKFIGSYDQIPPMYSAVKIEGKRLYELARNGITVERKPRKVNIYSLRMIKVEKDDSLNALLEKYILQTPIPATSSQWPSIKVLFDVACSKGTYVRTLCSDIGERLGCGGHMSFLIRLKSDVFDIEHASTFEEIIEASRNNNIKDLMVQVDEVFKDMDEIVLSSDDERRLVNGAAVRLDVKNAAVGQQFRIYNKHDDFIALGEALLVNDRLLLKSKKLFVM